MIVPAPVLPLKILIAEFEKQRNNDYLRGQVANLIGSVAADTQNSEAIAAQEYLVNFLHSENRQLALIGYNYALQIKYPCRKLQVVQEEFEQNPNNTDVIARVKKHILTYY